MAIQPSNGKTVLVTGIGGYIAGVLGLLLLQKGYTVRGTTRHAASLERFLKRAYAPYADRVKIYEVSNMTVDGAFDEAAKGVDGIFHTASPIDLSLTTYDEFVGVAKRGNETLLASALKAGPQLSSVVVTSSVAAIVDPKEDPEYIYTEADWASGALAAAEKNKEAGVPTPPGQLYGASKTAADQTMWNFRDTRKVSNPKNYQWNSKLAFRKPSFALTSINPSAVIGPPVNLPSSGSKLNETLTPIRKILSGTSETIPPNIGSASAVDVRDVAFAHVWAFENPSKADGQRYITTQGFGPLQAAADVLRAEYKGTAFAEKITVGTPGEGYVGYDKTIEEVGVVEYPAGRPRVDGSKASKTMGFSYIRYKQSVIDTAKALESIF